MIRTSRGFLLAVVPLLMAARGYEATPVSNIIMPPEPALDPSAELTVVPGGAIFDQQIFAAPGAALARPITVSIAGVNGDFAVGTVLQKMTLTGQASGQLSGAAGVYCVRPNGEPNAAANISKAVIGNVAFGIFGGLQRTGIDNRFCFIDKDGDGQVETAVLVGAKRQSDRVPLAITPVSVKLTASSKMKDPSQIVLRYVGSAGLAGTPTFAVELHENGLKRVIANNRRQVAFGTFPVGLDFFGTHFTVTAFDPASKALTVRRDKGFAAGAFHFDAPPQVYYIYVPG